MQTVEYIPTLERRREFSLLRFLLQTTLVFASVLTVTFVLRIFNLYPRISNISILYLLIILALASTCGRYAALLAAVVASLSFDFFLVPPLYTFTMARWEEWIALFVFLVTAIITSQLTAGLRQQRNQANAREREARILYELIRLTNSREKPEDQLEIVLLSLAHVFAAWGVHACALLLPDSHGALLQLVDTDPDGKGFSLSDEERLLAIRAMVQNQPLEKRYAPRPDVQDTSTHIVLYRHLGDVDILRLIPLRSGTYVPGVLCLRIRRPVPWFATIESMTQKRGRVNADLAFFWTFLEQVTSILERAHLRVTNVSRK